ncbi:ShlB/FhaC/HecB family hemolysin secretion/activation protein [Providencia stuartii]|uniref:ShlB/FhaC/HecB family hemolysin secretion/activation protein n=2 Tax=Providencia stuartii TaxID=588 RepID=A0AAI9GDB6_PROST|nr:MULTISPECIES: ShlB/FhaC/HecB family hemolysin secretion/activation protein [Providencia]ELR5111744.1 ShlB/FhaC/HecB family hemolysin secretion/activation protein [Providencia stuartii]ELR5299066.1 ShlB/FhaC/HecB family hemolysin secretion/activation protein [Providencia stuartii]MDW7587479.1 ShlB/FhaC/HecB family hemolysin secretion/activation protein [Providencia sp. 2023EL-00965]
MFLRLTIISLSVFAFMVYADPIQPIDQQINNQISQDKSRYQQTQLTTKDVLDDKAEIKEDKLYFQPEQNCYEIKSIHLDTERKIANMRLLQQYVDQAVGQCLGIYGMETLAKGLQDKIIKIGYVTTRVNIPEQNISKGLLKLKIIPGTVDNIKLTDNSSEYISLFNTMPTEKGKVLNLRDLEQGLENLERIPGVKTNIELMPGKEFSTTDIEIERVQSSYFNVGGWLNNAGSRQTGKNQIGVTVYGNNLTSLNDTIYVSMGKNLENRARYSTKNQAIYYAVPYNYWLYSVYASKSNYKQTINDSIMSYKYYGENRYLNFSASHVFLRGQSYKDSLTFQLMKRKSRYHLEDISLLSQERDLTNINIGLNHRQNINNSTVDASINYQRNVQWLGAKPSWDMEYGDVSKMGRIITIDVNAVIPFSFDNFVMSYNPQVFIQYTPDNLTIQDQFSLGNRWTVRGFDEEYSLIGDKGFYFRNEFNFYFPNVSIYPYYALDYGRIIGDIYPIGLYSNDQLLGSALGVRGNFNIFNYDLFIAVPLYKPAEYETSDLNIGLNVQWFW